MELGLTACVRAQLLPMGRPWIWRDIGKKWIGLDRSGPDHGFVRRPVECPSVTQNLGTMARPVPVLLMTHSLGIGGSERQMAEVAKALDPRDFEVHAVCFNAEGLRADELRAAGVPILELPVTSFGSFSALTGRPDAIAIHSGTPHRTGA